MDPMARRWEDPFARLAIRSAQFLLVVAALVAAGLVFETLRLVFVPLLFGMILASTAWPLVRRMRARGVGDIVAATITLVGLFGVLTVLSWIVIAGVSGEWRELVDGAMDGLRTLDSWVKDVVPFPASEINELQRQLFDGAPVDVAREQATAGAVTIAEVVSGMLLTLVITFFLLKDGASFASRAVRHAPERHRERVERIGARSVEVLGAFVRGTAIVAVVDAVAIGAALVILGVPLALPLSVVVFLGAFVPLVGATVAGAMAALVALVSEGPITALIVVGVVIAANRLEGDLLAPVVLGNAVSMHPLAILLALTAGLIVGGIVGGLLAVPLFAVLWTVVTAWDADPEAGGLSAGGAAAIPDGASSSD